MKNKDVIYVDVEDEITNIIDKVISSKSKIVALVLPKRATIFQSIVNMKLLKKKALDAKKQVVLVTSEAGLMPLAGVVGVHIAKSLQDQPEIPVNPNAEVDENAPINLEDDSDPTLEDEKIDNSKPIGELAGLAAVGATVARNDEETIEFDNDALADPMGLDEIDNDSNSKNSKKAKGIDGKTTKVPNFDKFKKRLLIGFGILVALIALWYVMYKVLPKATITVQTNTSSISSNIDLTLSQADQNIDLSNNIIPAKYETTTKTSTSTPVNTTGTKAIGTSATGTATVSYPNNSCNFACPADSIPAGTVFTDPTGNFSYTSNSTASIPQCHGNVKNCSIPPVPVTATKLGTTYNISGGSGWTSSGSTANGNPLASYNISGSTMTGGSSQNVQVVTQADITSAQNQLKTASSSQIESQLESTLQSAGYTPITSTFVATAPTFTPNQQLGAQANTVTVTETATYSMYGVKQSDLDTFINANVTKQINPANQSILNTGSTTATYTVQSTSAGSMKVSMQASSTIGPKLDANAITKQSAGQKSADIQSSISQTPGVTKVTVKYSPFWVTSTPTKVNKITVIIQKSDGSKL